MIKTSVSLCAHCLYMCVCMKITVYSVLGPICTACAGEFVYHPTSSVIDLYCIPS